MGEKGLADKYVVPTVKYGGGLLWGLDDLE